jgi:hypothetical protein
MMMRIMKRHSVLVTEILNGETCQIVQDRGNFLLIDFDCSAQQRAQMSCGTIFNN